MKPFKDRYLSKWAWTCLPFPQDLNIKSTSEYRNSNGMEEHSWCSNPEAPCVMPVTPIYLTFIRILFYVLKAIPFYLCQGLLLVLY